MTRPLSMTACVLAACAAAGCSSSQNSSQSSSQTSRQPTTTVGTTPAAKTPVAPAATATPAASGPTLPSPSPTVATGAKNAAPAASADDSRRAARRFADSYVLYSYGFLPLTGVQPAAASVRAFLAKGRHVPTKPIGSRPRIIDLKFAPVAGGYVGVVATYSTSSSVSAFAFDISNKTGRWQAEQLEG